MKWNKKIMSFNERSISFKYDIKDVVCINELNLVLLDIPYGIDEICNVVAYNNDGVRVWKLPDCFDKFQISKKLPFDYIRLIDGIVYVIDFYGRRFSLDPSTGEALSYDVVK